MPLPMASPPVALPPSYDAPAGIVGNNLLENPTTRDNEVAKKRVSKKARMAAPSVSFPISTSPLPNADDVFIDSLLTHGGINDNNNILPPPMPQNKNKKVLPTTLPKPTSLPSLTMSPVSPVTLGIQISDSPFHFSNIIEGTTPAIPLITTKIITQPEQKDLSHVPSVNLLHLVDSPVDNTIVTVRRSNQFASPNKLSNNVSPLSNVLFLDDPTRSSPLSTDASELTKLIGNEYLCTGFIDYLIQPSIKHMDNNDTIVASSLSLSLMQSFLKNNEDNSEVVSKCAQLNIRNTYHCYSSKTFWLLSMVCMKHHFFLIGLKFNASYPQTHL
jgi:hypothetical protein